MAARLKARLSRATFAAKLLVVGFAAGCARVGKDGSTPAKQPVPAQQPAGQPGSVGQDEGAELTTVEAAEAEFARVERELDGLWGGADKPEAKDDRANRCETSCKAFLSLERAAAAICRLAGDADQRCAGAKKTVEKNRQRIAECACS